MLTWRYTLERVSCFGCMYEDWEMSTDRFKLPCRFCAAVISVSFTCLDITCAPVYFCVILCHSQTQVRPHAIELQLLEV